MIRTSPVSVVICTYSDDRWSEMVEAVDSVRAQSMPAEVIVVVDHNDALLRRARTSFPDVTVVENAHPRGLSGARNTGTDAAGGDIVAFLDDDAVAEPDWLAWLTAPYGDPDVLGVGGRIDPLWASGHRPRCLPSEFDWVVGCTYRGMPDVPGPVRNVIGANMSFRRDVLLAAGGFRVGIGRVGARPVGCEETEMCIRAAQRFPQGRFLFEPRARVMHRVPVERSGWRYFRDRCMAEGYSKALVARCVGSRDGLASERHYTLRTLPAGVARGIGDGVRRRDPSGFGRGAAIAGGLALTTAGYVYGLLAHQLSAPRSARSATLLSTIKEKL